MTDWSTKFDDNFWNDDVGNDDAGDVAAAPDPAAGAGARGGVDVDEVGAGATATPADQIIAVGKNSTITGTTSGTKSVAPAPVGGGGGGGGSGIGGGGFRCPNCNSSNIESLGPSASSVCTDCGIIVEENAIVSSVEFVEGAGGSSSMVGQFVGANSSRGFGTGGGRRGGQYGFSRQSRENTLASGKRRIQEVAALMRLGPHYVDSAHRLFTVAVERNFVQGRRRAHVIAACLYTSCRQEKSQHMLIDFSDALQINVYTLGTCFLKFRRLLGLKSEIIDPALFI